VITADFYGANELLPLTDDEIVARVKSHLEVRCFPNGSNMMDVLCKLCEPLIHVASAAAVCRGSQAGM
jgi:hypothetical protein